jgi:hypothetical protein
MLAEDLITRGPLRPGEVSDAEVLRLLRLRGLQGGERIVVRVGHGSATSQNVGILVGNSPKRRKIFNVVVFPDRETGEVRAHPSIPSVASSLGGGRWLSRSRTWVEAE